MSTTGDTHRTVFIKSCGHGLSNRTPMQQLAPRSSQASNITEIVGTRPYERALRRSRGWFNHFPRKVVIARRVLGVSAQIVACDPRLPLTRTSVSPRVCVCPWSGWHWQSGARNSERGTPSVEKQPQTRAVRSSLSFQNACMVRENGVDGITDVIHLLHPTLPTTKKMLA